MYCTEVMVKQHANISRMLKVIKESCCAILEGPFRDFPAGTCEQTVYLLSLLRLIQPNLLLPATTALGTIRPDGRERGLQAGANVVMPNLSPLGVRKKYALYDGKLCTGEEAAQCIGCLSRRVTSVGCRIVTARGDIIR